MARKKTDFEWGARSALQKAIRRGDVQMGRKAVEVLFSREPSWFFWRMPAIVPEEVWQVANRIPDRLNRLKILKETEGTEAVVPEASALVSALCSMVKNRDANGLTIVAEDRWFSKVDLDTLPPLRRKQLKMQRRAMLLHKYKDSESFFSAFRSERANVPEDRLQYVDAARYRYDMGGMEGDQRMLMALSVIAVTEREIQAPMIRDIPDDARVPYEGDWPWYVYDMHTKVGRSVLYKYIAKYHVGMTADDFRLLWFVRESGKVDRHDETAFWWPFFTDLFDQYVSITREEWDSVHAPALAEMIMEELRTQ